MHTADPDHPSSAAAAVRTLRWAHGEAELQTLGGMLAPVRFSAPGRPPFSPLQVAPWGDEPGWDARPRCR